MSNPIFLRQKIEPKAALAGKIDGVAYSGAVVPDYWPYENLVIDVATLTIAKPKTPILRDHDTSKVAGVGVASIQGNQVMLDGQLSQTTPHGMEITQLAAEGVEWEQSLGVYEGDLEEVINEEVNGNILEHGWVLRNGILREVSVTILGADMNTNATVLSAHQKGDFKMKLTPEQAIRLACACGGSKDSDPEELIKKVEADKKLAAGDSEKISGLEKQVADKQAEIDALKAEIEKVKAGDEEKSNEDKINAAVKEKGIELAAEKIKDAAKSKEKTEILLSVIADMKKVETKKIDPKLGGAIDLGAKGKDGAGAGEKVKASDTAGIRLAAKKLVEEGKAKNLLEAMSMVPVETEEK